MTGRVVPESARNAKTSANAVRPQAVHVNVNVNLSGFTVPPPLLQPFAMLLALALLAAAPAPKSASAWLSEGFTAQSKKDHDAAIAAFQKALDSKPKTTTRDLAWRGLGISYSYKKDTANAVKYLRKYLPLCPLAEQPQILALLKENGVEELPVMR